MTQNEGTDNLSDIIELTQIDYLIERMVHKKMFTKETEIFQYIKAAKETIDELQETTPD